jgi:cytoplasmic iron level regulating protein YaaA (DUF328/UPF0246 family)
MRATNYFESIINTSALTQTSIQSFHVQKKGTEQKVQSWRNKHATGKLLSVNMQYSSILNNSVHNLF